MIKLNKLVFYIVNSIVIADEIDEFKFDFTITKEKLKNIENNENVNERNDLLLIKSLTTRQILKESVQKPRDMIVYDFLYQAFLFSI